MSASNPPEVPSMEQIKATMRATWMAGDFGMVAKAISGGAEAFVARMDLPAGARVLDVACGTGNLSIPLAKRGCSVTGVDIAPNLVEQARARAAAEGLNITFDEGDAEALPYAGASFDAVVTMFGAMFAPRPAVVASELARVLRPGGQLAMANWNPTSFSGRLFKVGSNHSMAPPSGLPAPVLWGDDATARERLAPYFDEIKTELVPIKFDLPTGPAGAVEFFRKYFGPTNVAFNRLDAAGQQAFSADLEALWAGANIATDPDRTTVANEYLRVSGVRK